MSGTKPMPKYRDKKIKTDMVPTSWSSYFTEKAE